MALRGLSADWVIFDELADDWWPPAAMQKAIEEWAHKPIQLFEDPDFPAAKVMVCEVQFDRNHPRNPNPAAGPVMAWIVRTEEKVAGQPFIAKQLAIHAGRELHNKLVKALRQLRIESQPNFGRF